MCGAIGHPRHMDFDALADKRAEPMENEHLIILMGDNDDCSGDVAHGVRRSYPNAAEG
jgi:hypothetical protein